MTPGPGTPGDTLADMIAIDHIIVVVDDLENAADELLTEYGLASLEGGRHAGHGTGNRLVPLGREYLELMAVVDEPEARSSPLGRWALSRASSRLLPAALCLRTTDISVPAEALSEKALPMSRLKPDGTTLSWHLVGLDGMLEYGHPFFIEWHCEPTDHPAASGAPHRVDPIGLAGVVIGSVPRALESMVIGLAGLEIETGTAGIRSAVIATADGTITLGATRDSPASRPA